MASAAALWKDSGMLQFWKQKDASFHDLFWWVITFTLDVTVVNINDMASFIPRKELTYCVLFLTACTSKFQQPSIVPVKLRPGWCELVLLKLAGIKAVGFMNIDHGVKKDCFLFMSPSLLEHSHHPNASGSERAVGAMESSVFHSHCQNNLYC